MGKGRKGLRGKQAIAPHTPPKETLEDDVSTEEAADDKAQECTQLQECHATPEQESHATPEQSQQESHPTPEQSQSQAATKNDSHVPRPQSPVLADRKRARSEKRSKLTPKEEVTMCEWYKENEVLYNKKLKM